MSAALKKKALDKPRVASMPGDGRKPVWCIPLKVAIPPNRINLLNHPPTFPTGKKVRAIFYRGTAIPSCRPSKSRKSRMNSSFSAAPGDKLVVLVLDLYLVRQRQGKQVGLRCENFIDNGFNVFPGMGKPERTVISRYTQVR